jgi:hypothetical protein
MRRVAQQIGWGQESKLYYQVLQQLNRLTSILGKNVPIYYYAANVCYSISGVIVKSHVELSIGDVVLTSDGYCYAINGINPGPGYNVTYVSHQTCFVAPCPTTTTTTTATPSLRLLFDSVENINRWVGDPTVVSNWNNFFQISTYGGTPFSSVSVNDTTIRLYGGANITLWDGMFDYGNFLYEIDDSLGCIVYVENYVFIQNYSLTLINLPTITNLGSTVGNDNVFLDISGNTITLIVPSALMTCNSGNPDGDIQYLQANNTVTIITV